MLYLVYTFVRSAKGVFIQQTIINSLRTYCIFAQICFAVFGGDSYFKKWILIMMNKQFRVACEDKTVNGYWYQKKMMMKTKVIEFEWKVPRSLFDIQRKTKYSYNGILCMLMMNSTFIKWNLLTTIDIVNCTYPIIIFIFTMKQIDVIYHWLNTDTSNRLNIFCFCDFMCDSLNLANRIYCSQRATNVY